MVCVAHWATPRTENRSRRGEPGPRDLGIPTALNAVSVRYWLDLMGPGLPYRKAVNLFPVRVLRCAASVEAIGFFSCPGGAVIVATERLLFILTRVPGSSRDHVTQPLYQMGSWMPGEGWENNNPMALFHPVHAKSLTQMPDVAVTWTGGDTRTGATALRGLVVALVAPTIMPPSVTSLVSLRPHPWTPDFRLVRVHYGGPDLTVGSTVFEMWMVL